MSEVPLYENTHPSPAGVHARPLGWPCTPRTSPTVGPLRNVGRVIIHEYPLYPAYAPDPRKMVPEKDFPISISNTRTGTHPPRVLQEANLPFTKRVYI